MILMIDNYDSFTYNIVQYLGELGEQVEVYRNDEISLDEISELNPDRIVVSPGPCTPNEAGISMDVIRKFSGFVPILGVCLGHQSIGQVFGGKIEVDDFTEKQERVDVFGQSADQGCLVLGLGATGGGDGGDRNADF